MQKQMATRSRITKPVQNKKSYSVAEIQQILGISRPTAYNLIKQNLFQSVHTSGNIRIIKASFDAWLDVSI